MNIHDVVRVTRVTEQVLAEKTDLNALDRMELCLALQVALINSVVNECDADCFGADSSRPALAVPLKTGRGFSLRAMTTRAVPMVEALDKVLGRLPHGEDAL